MATKKKKPVSAEFNTIDVDQATSAPVTEGMTASDELQAKAGVVELSLSEEVRQKIDAYEKLAEENAKYAQQVSELQDRMAQYIQEIQELKAASPSSGATDEKRIADLEAENSMLKTKLNAANSALAAGPKPAPKPQPRIQPNCYRRRVIDGGYLSWN